MDIDIETVYGACEVTDSSTGGFGPDYGEDAESDVVGYEVGVDTGVGAGAVCVVLVLCSCRMKPTSKKALIAQLLIPSPCR